MHCSRFRTSKQNLIKLEWSLVKKICQGKQKKKPMLFLNYPLRLYFSCFSSLPSNITQSEYWCVVNELEVAHFRVVYWDLFFICTIITLAGKSLWARKVAHAWVCVRALVQTEQRTTAASSLLEAGESQQLLHLPLARVSAGTVPGWHRVCRLEVTPAAAVPRAHGSMGRAVARNGVCRPCAPSTRSAHAMASIQVWV